MENIIFNINSEFRRKGYNSHNFITDLRYKLKNIIYMKVTSFEIPNVAYTFTNEKKNNYFFIIYRFKNDVYRTMITMGEGNYTSTSIIEKIQEQFKLINDKYNLNINIKLDTISGKIVVISHEQIYIEFENSSLNKYLGFRENKYSGYELKGENIINLISTPYIFLKINDIENIVDNHVPNVFTKIVLNSEKYTYHFQGKDDFNSKDKYFRGPIDIDKLHVSLVDYLGNPFDLNNMDFSFTIEFGVIYSSKLYSKIVNKKISNVNKKILSL